jgi:hypothetical protein
VTPKVHESIPGTGEKHENHRAISQEYLSIYIYILGDTLKWGAEPRTKNGDIIGK